MSDLLDQSALTDLADRLVEAARRAGADSADAVAVRSVSTGVEVREGAVEESERSESDDVGLRVFVGRRQAVVSTNDIAANVDDLAARAVAMAKVAPEDAYAGLADPDQLARTVPDLDLLDPDLPSVAELERRAQDAEAAGLAVKGVSKSGGASASAGIGGMVLVTSHGFHGAYLSSRQGVSMTAVAGEGTAMERDYDFSSVMHGADLEPAERIGRTAGERAVARLNPRKVSTRKVPVVFDRRVAGSLRRSPGECRQWQCGRAQDELPAGQTGRAPVRSRASGLSTIRCAGAASVHVRSMARASPASRWR